MGMVYIDKEETTEVVSPLAVMLFFFRRVEDKQIFNFTFQDGTEFAENKDIQTGNLVGAEIINLFPVHLSLMGKFVFTQTFFF